MRHSAFAFLLLVLSAFSAAEGGAAPPSPSTIVFITATSDLVMEYQLLQAFTARWKERDPLALILPYPLTPYAFPLTPKAKELSAAAIIERLGDKKPGLFVVQGDPSLSLALELRDARFPGSPIIAFDIVDNEEKRKRLEGEKSLYIVTLSNIGGKNVELAARLFPDRKRAVLLLFVGKELQTAKVINDGFVSAFPELSFVTLPNPSQSSADSALRTSPENTFVISFSPGWIDSSGRYRSGKDYVRSISNTYNVPMFGYVRSNMDGGTVGGVGLSPARWGRDAADRGLSLVFDGKEPERWVAGGQFTSVFADYREIKRFGSSPKLLPPGAELINEPPSAWIRYQDILQMLLGVLVLTVAAFILQSIFKRREERLLMEANARLEKEVAERTGELRASNEEFEVSNANLIEAMRRTEEMQENVLRSARQITLGRFAAGMANGLNSPLSAVRSANEALRWVVGDGEAGFAARLLAFDEDQLALFLRFAPRALSRSGYLEEVSNAAPHDLERRLSRLSAEDAARVAADLSDAGLAGLDDAELSAFAGEKGPAVAQALYRLSVLNRSTWIIEESVDRAAETIRAVREYGAESIGETEAGIMDLRSTIERALLIFENRLPRSVTLRTDYGEVPPIRGSETIFVRIWANLLQNALQAMPGGGCLDVSLRRDEGFAVVSVGDEGEGVDPAIQDKIFEPFVTTREKAEGMGLGLAFCKKSIEAAGGEIGFARKERGTVFSVRVPLGGTA
jgi:signal transduction histidine kinase